MHPWFGLICLRSTHGVKLQAAAFDPRVSTLRQ